MQWDICNVSYLIDIRSKSASRPMRYTKSRMYEYRTAFPLTLITLCKEQTPAVLFSCLRNRHS